MTNAEPDHSADFRAEIRAWLAQNCPPGARHLPLGSQNGFWGGRNPEYPSEAEKVWFERMRDKGWTAPEWAPKYGGAGLDKHHAGILTQELRRIDAVSPLQSHGIWMLGPALLQFGTEEQKLEHLPKIARGEIRWVQGYSEPGAGSDLASVQTKGEDKGDHFLVNGTKIWTSSGDMGDMIFALVRTEPDAPKHLGISFLLIDMADPGVTTRRIKMINGDSPFTQTFFDNVKVPKSSVVGERGRGWDVAKYLLGHERQMIGSSMATHASEPIAAMARRLLGEEALRCDAALRQAIVSHENDAWMMTIAVERMRDQGKARIASPYSASILKMFGTELSYRRAELAMTVGGTDHLDPEGSYAREWLHAPGPCIAGGSTEVQLNIISKRALQLPEA